MKKAKLLMAFACLLFFSALAYTNFILDGNDQTASDAIEMQEIVNIAPAYQAPKAIQVAAKPAPVAPVKKKKKKVDVPVKKKAALPIAKFLENGIDWLAAAQYDNGGWGAGQQSAQHIRDPKAVKIDPATTAFSAMALMRAGNTPRKGPYAKNLKKALILLIEMTESSSMNHPNITTITGTQPQGKLGQNIDVAMAAQFFAKILDDTKHNQQLHSRTKKALEKCIQKIQKCQQKDGSWNDQGWAPVLQSAMANNALELGEVVGMDVDKETLARSREYQRKNVTSTGAIATEKAAGITLYAASSSQRATAQEAKKVRKALKNKKAFRRIETTSAPPAPEAIEEVVDLLEDEGYNKDDAYELASSYVVNRSAAQQMKNDAVLSGFGNNGGEEYLSYMMTSESLAEEDEAKEWLDWHKKMSQRLSKVQNGNGSWSGHHCITSPVFCTAAVIMTLTADRG